MGRMLPPKTTSCVGFAQFRKNLSKVHSIRDSTPKPACRSTWSWRGDFNRNQLKAAYFPLSLQTMSSKSPSRASRLPLVL